jgi:putative transposase
MTNHIHLVLQTDEIPLSRIMQNISLRYTKWINYTQKRMGHLFQGRYKALLLDADRYLMELVRYIHLNPVRAGMVVVPDEYKWSGHAAYLGRENLPWLTTEWVLSLFSCKSNEACARYAQFAKVRPYSEARAVAAYFVRELPGPSLTALGQMLGRDIASLGRAGTRIMKTLP